jgi:hypothetical protein
MENVARHSKTPNNLYFLAWKAWVVAYLAVSEVQVFWFIFMARP